MASIYEKLKRKKAKSENNDRLLGFDSPKNDLSEYNYTRSWDQELTEEVYGYDVPVPDMPPKEEIINFGRPEAEQIFRKTALPKDFNKLSREEQELFIEKEHHRRKNGLWFYIKGKPVYISGLFYYFLNYWPLETGKPARFHMGDWKFFMIWQLVVMDPTIFGLIVFKCRRVGDTEKALCMVYEYASRVRNTINQLYDCRVENDMKKTWRRLRIAHKRMVWFMRPVASNDEPASSFEFRVPKRKVDVSNSFVDENGNLIADEYEFKELDSDITYYTNVGGADGARVGRAYIDEFGKFKQINPEELWGLMKKALKDDRAGDIIGKALFTSTIEDMQGGKTLETSKRLWNKSNPNELDSSGSTTTGLIRIVRGAVDREPADRWGFVNEAEVVARMQARHKYLIEKKQWIDLIKERRQDCLTIEDVFSNISKGSPFHLENMSNRLMEITENPVQEWVKGNFEWKDGRKPVPGNPENVNKKCRVVFNPNENGRWIVRWHPKDYNLISNSMDQWSKLPSPGNTFEFSTGIDPISYINNITNNTDDDNPDKIKSDEERSLSGLAVKRNLDLNIDNISEDLFDASGDPIDGGRNFKTNRYCCVYLHRHDRPSDNFEDWLMTCIYYGSDFLIEKNHSGAFYQYLETMGFLQYYRQGGSGFTNSKGKQETDGLTASTKIIEAYFSEITELTNTWCNTIDIPLILEQLSTMEYETRGKHDLGVAIGYCEMLSNAKAQDIAARAEYESVESHDYVDEYEYD